MNDSAWYLLFVFSQMQLAEFFIWSGYNKFGSILGLISLVLQPIAAIYIVKNTKIRNMLLIAYIVFWIIGRTFFNKNIEYKSSVAKNCHLKWHFISNSIIYVLIWCLIIFIALFISKRYDVLLFAILTLLFSMYNGYKYESYGSLWCSIVVLAWLFLVHKKLYT